MYKRQELGASYFILKPFDLRTIIKQIKQAKIKQQIPERPFVSVPEKIHGLTENQLEIIITNMIPVSYTHLDVYKRQFQHSMTS